MNQILGIAEARATLPSLVDLILSEPDTRIVIGSHRKPEAMIVPYSVESQRPSQPSLLDQIKSKSRLVKRLAAISNIGSVSVVGSVARGEDQAESDIDFLIEALPGATMFDIAAFEIDMETLFDRKVDAITAGSLEPAQRSRILSEALTL
ncbi:MAG: nucleotidyltransferase domain-containing protein [Rhodoglobus sp.]